MIQSRQDWLVDRVCNDSAHVCQHHMDKYLYRYKANAVCIICNGRYKEGALMKATTMIRQRYFGVCGSQMHRRPCYESIMEQEKVSRK